MYIYILYRLYHKYTCHVNQLVSHCIVGMVDYNNRPNNMAPYIYMD